ncbi:MAG: multicopper polyphenol oxidase [Cellulomonas sp. 73-92]|uniref:peptidoglycan editing factor PgeF n=1 Tax=Cellulomonas sp. 73-92 TaxID=1895740 RepID=UPI000927876D|nr:peptidoglycan editing factor PgeF [Cellulomonas sp. 73-92]OJV79720.1 MAG: multicopper polyphenol oxidase [Cellulomonas sp. 73-92]
MTAAPAWEAVDLGPGVLAAFTGRAGGVSRAPWDSLDLGLGVGDDEADVLANRARLAGWAGAPVAFGTQVHGAGVLVVGGGRYDERTIGEADAYVTADEDVAVAVLVADCVPVLLADPEARVVAAVHAGRAGLVAGVVGAAVATMLAQGAQAERLRAVVGPSIAGSSYEVPGPMRDEVGRRLPEAPTTTSWGTPALDLPAAAAGELARAGVRDVARIDRDTFTDPGLYSHRRATAAGTTTGRSCGLVRLLPM